jgi:hypothetical protein
VHLHAIRSAGAQVEEAESRGGTDEVWVSLDVPCCSRSGDRAKGGAKSERRKGGTRTGVSRTWFPG